MITVLGFPRSGTNWLHHILAYGPDSVQKVHWKYQLLGDEYIIYIYRDPRDTAVSGYYYYLNAFGWKWGHTIENFSLLDFLETRFANGFDGYEGWPTGWWEHYEWARKQHFYVSISYEEMVDNLYGTLTQTFHGDWIDVAVRNEAPGSTRRVPYTRNLGWSSAQKTVSPGYGEWTHHFGPAELAWMDNYLK